MSLFWNISLGIGKIMQRKISFLGSTIATDFCILATFISIVNKNLIMSKFYYRITLRNL